MTLPDPVSDVRARTHTANPAPGRPATSTNAERRPPLRLVTDPTHIQTTPAQAPAAPGPSNLDELDAAIRNHRAIGEHPPTVAEAAANLWLPYDQVRHGRLGQFGAAAAGLIQTLGLAACWGTAHALFSTKTRAVIFLLALITAGAAWAVASHA